jgi:hypothetical protein
MQDHLKEWRVDRGDCRLGAVRDVRPALPVSASAEQPHSAPAGHGRGFRRRIDNLAPHQSGKGQLGLVGCPGRYGTQICSYFQRKGRPRCLSASLGRGTSPTARPMRLWSALRWGPGCPAAGWSAATACGRGYSTAPGPPRLQIGGVPRLPVGERGLWEMPQTPTLRQVGQCFLDSLD